MSRHISGRIVAGVLSGVMAFSAAHSAELKTTRIAGGIDRATWAVAAPNDTSRLFILEQETGRIRILDLTTRQFRSTPFLTVTGLVVGGEAGLLGMAFHPSYPDSPYFYVDHNGANAAINIARYTVSSNPDIALASSRRLILRFTSPADNHNGGWLGFGPDGYLYISVGDGGGTGDDDVGHDPLVGNAQSDTTRRGKILRLDVDHGNPYAIPPSNPFFGSPSPKNEFWVKGLRNPWRCTIDRGNGDLYIADVGQALWEEVSYIPASSPGGENLGWRKFEGYDIYNCPDPCDSSGLTRPVHVYGHDGVRCAITGGMVYRGQAMPGLRGAYFFADFCSNQIWSFRMVGGQLTDFRERTADLVRGEGAGISSISTFGEDAKGELYILTRAPSGEIFRIDPDPDVLGTPKQPAAPLLSLGRPRPNPGGERIVFRAVAERPGRVRITVHDLGGRLITTLLDEPGPLQRDVVWNGRGPGSQPVHAGLYFLRLEHGGEWRSERVAVMR